MKYEVGLAWMILSLAVTGCNQSLPLGRSSQTPVAPVIIAPANTVGNSKSSKTFTAAELKASFVDEAQLLQLIDNEISNDRCSSDRDCTTISIGEKACGGPERWLACTRESAKKPALQPTLAELINLHKTRNARSSLLSNCQISPDPGAMCRANRCVLRPANGAI